MIISPFTPLFFERGSSCGTPTRYVQTFARTDEILLECLCLPSETPLFTIVKDGEQRSLALNSWQVNDEVVLWFTVISGLEDGVFELKENQSGLVSLPFRVTADPQLLANTTLIQYSMDSNRRRSDGVFLIDRMRRFFDFRVHGGFKDSDITYSVDTEQFTTSEGDICSLYALDTTQKKFTLGGQEGVPASFAELLNRILCCTYVYFDGVRYSRSGTSAPEPTTLLEGLDSFVYKVNVQKVCHLNPTIENGNQVSLRRIISTENYRKETTYNILSN